MTVTAVIFDIGNVLIEWQPERFFDRAVGADRRRALFDAVDLHGMNDRIDRGADFREVICETARATPDFEAEIRMWHDNWIELASPEIPRSVSLLRALKANGVPVFALSNFGRTSFDLARAHYPFLDTFDRRYISGRLGITKPDPKIYEMVEADCGHAPEHLLFTDDRPDNIAAARSRGWQVHLFDGPQGWRARLMAEGLLTSKEVPA